MAVTYGFYDSLNHDRLYNAQQMSAIFDGIINDGVFMSVGNQFHTVAGTGMQVIVKSGRAWFDSTWTLNDAEYPLSIDAADVLLTRIDAVVLEVNSEVATRANTIKVVKGTPASTPAKPTLTNTATIHQHALAYVTVAKNTTAITNSMIEIVVGKTETPYVTAILQTTDITDLYNQWEDYFQTWFDNVRSTLDGDVALNLQNQITTLERSILKGDTKTSMGLPSDAVGDDAFNYLLDKQNKMKTAYSAASDVMMLIVDQSTTFKIPKNLSTDYFDMVGIGGGGGCGWCYNDNTIRGGGGAGGYTVIKRVKKEQFPELFTDRKLTVIIGAGGNSGATSGSNGETGGNTIVTITSNNTDILFAKGGGGGGSSGASIGGSGGSGGSGGGGGGCISENGDGGNGGIGYTGGGGGGGGGGDHGTSGSGGNGYYGGAGGGGTYTGTAGSGGSGTHGGSGGNGGVNDSNGINGSDMLIDNYDDISILNTMYTIYNSYYNDIRAYKSKGGNGGTAYTGYGSGGGGGGGGGFRSCGGAGGSGKNSLVGTSGGGGGGYMSSGHAGYNYGNSENYGKSNCPCGGGGGNMFTLDNIIGQKGNGNQISSYLGYGSGGRGLGLICPVFSARDSDFSHIYREFGVGGDSSAEYNTRNGGAGVVLFIFYIDNKI